MAAPMAEEPRPSTIPLWRMALKTGISEHNIDHTYPGSGTEDDPYVVSWLTNDKLNPFAFSKSSKWTITIIVSLATLTVSLISSAYTGGLVEVVKSLDTNEELSLLGVSVFVVGFAVGPLLWAPLSETYGRRPVFLINAIALTAFTAGAAASPNIQSLIIFRFLAGSFGSAPMAISGGVIADTFPAVERGFAAGLYAGAPFMGPALGPVIGGFLAEGAGWREVEWLLVALSGAMLVAMYLFLPETYAPVLLRERAQALSKTTERVYRSKVDMGQGKLPMTKVLSVALSRPWVLLFCEPIVLLLSLYLAIIYGTLYMFLAAYPIVFGKVRGWGEGTTGLTFLGIMVGIMGATVYTVPMYQRYKRKFLQSKGNLSPEDRLPDAFLGAIALPVGLFWFAWTNSPSIHWMVPIAAGVPFGFGMVTVFLAVLNYLVDAYTIYAASVLAANSLLRSVFGAAFPLFTNYMYRDLGIHWASSIPAFLALACLPMPFLFHRYGSPIRERSHYAAEASAIMKRYLETAEMESEARQQTQVRSVRQTSEKK
ncbi:MFS general substrate transporter [Penicillium verrucosum]|uniref:MFS general substrate transporter n=1 Tax=Penicillium verrucosum TaxID=60171 RepID=UPI00254582C6|nr:MFS general substrate transporter [Penicillium verrucosum]KAJ5933212.1 MFS general substrate transporter [Penicillium verrucosum]